MRYLLLILLLLVPLTARAEIIHLAAAASLRELVTEAAESFERQHPEHEVLVNTASSGTLARQIAAGAPADLFLSANPQWMDHLVAQGRIGADQPVFWASNRLVVVGRGEPLAGLDGLLTLERIAIGSPGSTPVGQYARGMLQAAGLYSGLEADRKLVLAKDVRQALLFAEQGAADAAIIYASDVRLLDKTQQLLTPAAMLQPEIRYPIAVTRQGQAKPAAVALFEMLTDPRGAALLTKYGLAPLLHTERVNG